MTAHPGRIALLTYAAFSPTLTTQQRLTNVRLVFGTDSDEDAILTAMKTAHDLHRDSRTNDAQAILSGLIADHFKDA